MPAREEDEQEAGNRKKHSGRSTSASCIRPDEFLSYSLFACQPPQVLYHYTDLAGAYGVLCSKSLWLTPLRYLNDGSELGVAISLLKKSADEASRTAPSAGEAEFLKLVAGQVDSFSKSNVCIAAFCESGDLLSQWRAYGGRGSGVALGFRGEIGGRLKQTGEFNLWRCIYNPELHQRVIFDLLGALQAAFRSAQQQPDSAKRLEELITSFNTAFLRVGPVLKSEHFAEEKEWRIISSDIPHTHPAYTVRLKAGQLKEHYELGFPRFAEANETTLDHINIGPTADPELATAPLRVLLHQNGFKGCGIKVSEIPYRAQ